MTTRRPIRFDASGVATPEAEAPVDSRRFSSIAYLWILPALILLAAFLFYPISFSMVLSFFEWNGLTPGPLESFVGADNYLNLVADKFFKTALSNSLIFVFAVITVQIGIALVLAIFVFMGEFRGAAWLRGVIFFPSVLSAVVVGIVWRNVIFLREGLIDIVTTTFSLPSFFPLGDPDIAFYAITTVAIWQGIGFNLIIFYAGLQSLNQETIEAALIDGASFWRLLYHVIVPLQRPVIMVSVMLNVIGGFQVFDLVSILSKGVMANTHITDVLATYMMFNSFGGSSSGSFAAPGVHKMGYSSVIAIVIMVLSLVFALLRNRVRKAIEY